MLVPVVPLSKVLLGISPFTIVSMMLTHRLALVVLFSISVCSAGPVSVVFTTLPAVFENGSYNGFATATIDGSLNQLLICDDSEHVTYVPSGNLVYEYSNIVGATPLQYARFVSSPGNPTPSELLNYEEAAVLVWELTAAGPSASADLVTDYQYSLWNLFTPNTSLFRANQAQLQTDARNVALGNVTAPVWLSTAYTEFEIFTPTGASAGNQEFLGLDPPPVPEPAMGWPLAFLGCVFSIVAGNRRRRSQFSESCPGSRTSTRP